MLLRAVKIRSADWMEDIRKKKVQGEKEERRKSFEKKNAKKEEAKEKND